MNNKNCIEWFTVGYISKSIAKKAGIPAGVIVISTEGINHIKNGHRREFDKIGISIIDYVRIVTKNFDAIIDNRDGTYKIVKTNKDNPSGTVCVAELRRECTCNSWKWCVITSQPQRNPFNPGKAGKKVLWKRKGSSKATLH